MKGIIEKQYGNVMEHGTDGAAKLRVDSAIGLNEFYTDRNGTEELVSAKRNEGGFVHIINTIDEDEKVRDTFTCDMIITNVRHVEADEEKETPEKAIVKGAIFNFRNDLLPVEFTALNPKAIDYFEDLGATQSNPVFTKVWGRQVSTTVVKKLKKNLLLAKLLCVKCAALAKTLLLLAPQKNHIFGTMKKPLLLQNFLNLLRLAKQL